jgi:hypothetical protein
MALTTKSRPALSRNHDFLPSHITFLNFTFTPSFSDINDILPGIWLWSRLILVANPDSDNMGYVRVRRKGGKTEYIPLNHKACKAIAAYLAIRPNITGETALFVSQFKRPLSTRAIQERVTKYLTEAGIINASVHTLRHTTATHHVARGTDLKTVQETLGRADLKTTTMSLWPRPPSAKPCRSTRCDGACGDSRASQVLISVNGGA